MNWVQKDGRIDKENKLIESHLEQPNWIIIPGDFEHSRQTLCVFDASVEDRNTTQLTMSVCTGAFDD